MVSDDWCFSPWLMKFNLVKMSDAELRWMLTCVCSGYHLVESVLLSNALWFVQSSPWTLTSDKFDIISTSERFILYGFLLFRNGLLLFCKQAKSKLWYYFIHLNQIGKSLRILKRYSIFTILINENHQMDSMHNTHTHIKTLWNFPMKHWFCLSNIVFVSVVWWFHLDVIWIGWCMNVNYYYYLDLFYDIC